MRQLKYHEKKLLRKVDFLQWKREHNLRELQVIKAFSMPALFMGAVLPVRQTTGTMDCAGNTIVHIHRTGATEC